ncbi:MAG: peptide chain release factor N(5)-glutamine methyltransferase [Anaerolineae bacterium]|nr:peptide chain release factor N(5)-glutamine methyltransferase [Anaerolineae bacterium]
MARAQPESQARLEAEVLLAHAVGHPRAWLYARPEECPQQAEAERYLLLVERRLRGVPLEYLTGRAFFHGIQLEVTPDVLVPRPETELLVGEAMAALQGAPQPWLADVGTGSGAVALALAHALPELRAVGTDISLAALRVAARNVQALGLESRVSLVNCDLLSAISSRFAVVVANLPYVSSEDLTGASADVVRHEPRQALDGGSDGLSVVRRLLAQLADHLQPNGLALLEIGSDQGRAATQAAHALLPGTDVAVIPDQWGRERVLRLRVPG